MTIDIVEVARRHKYADHIGCMVNRLADEVERLRAERDLEKSSAASKEEATRLLADRRERIATAALQGLLSNPSTSSSPWEIVVAATAYADALINKLGEEPQP